MQPSVVRLLEPEKQPFAACGVHSSELACFRASTQTSTDASYALTAYSTRHRGNSLCVRASRKERCASLAFRLLAHSYPLTARGRRLQIRFGAFQVDYADQALPQLGDGTGASKLDGIALRGTLALSPRRLAPVELQADEL